MVGVVAEVSPLVAGVLILAAVAYLAVVFAVGMRVKLRLRPFRGWPQDPPPPPRWWLTAWHLPLLLIVAAWSISGRRSWVVVAAHGVAVVVWGWLYVFLYRYYRPYRQQARRLMGDSE